MDVPKLEILDDAEVRVQVQGIVKDAERQLLIATFNRHMNPGADGEPFDRQIAKLKDGLARLKSNPSWAKYMMAAEQ